MSTAPRQEDFLPVPDRAWRLGGFFEWTPNSCRIFDISRSHEAVNSNTPTLRLSFLFLLQIAIYWTLIISVAFK